MRPVCILVPPVCCKTPTQLVQLFSRVWLCSELWHLHHANWCVCISMRTSLCVQNESVLSSPAIQYTHRCVCVCCREWVTLCALACGYLEVSADVVSACGSGFTILCLIETCIHLADSSTVRGRSFCLFCTLFCAFTNNFYNFWVHYTLILSVFSLYVVTSAFLLWKCSK